jgi:hypothetical protein
LQQFFRAIARVGITAAIGALIGAGITILLQVNLGHGTNWLTGAVIMAILTGIPALAIAVILQILDAIGQPVGKLPSAVIGGFMVLALAFMNSGADNVIASIVFFAFGMAMGAIHYRVGVYQRSAA